MSFNFRFLPCSASGPTTQPLTGLPQHPHRGLVLKAGQQLFHLPPLQTGVQRLPSWCVITADGQVGENGKRHDLQFNVVGKNG